MTVQQRHRLLSLVFRQRVNPGMSIDHKAYLFRYDQFHDELANLLLGSLQTGEVDPLREFINRYRASLTDFNDRGVNHL
jgi:hypothetical protein